MGLLIEFPNELVYSCEKKEKEEDILDVANYFFFKESMRLKKAQKLCYLSQCHYIGIYNKRLIDVNFEAWVNGPTSRILYQKYSEWKELNIPCFNTPKIKDKQHKEFLDVIYSKYHKLNNDELMKLIKKDGVWLKTRDGLKEREPCIDEISDDLIYEKYHTYSIK